MQGIVQRVLRGAEDCAEDCVEDCVEDCAQDSVTSAFVVSNFGRCSKKQTRLARVRAKVNMWSCSKLCLHHPS